MSFKANEELLDQESLLASEHRKEIRPTRAARQRALFLPYSVALNFVLILAVVLLSLTSMRKAGQAYIPNEIYSPAQSAVEYKTVVFNGGLRGDKTAYQGSSDEVNARWEALYNEIGMSQISAKAASRLPNATTPVAGDPSQYMVELDVFHQLHCLNLMRKLVYPDVFHFDLTSKSEIAEDNIYHMEHCYDQLRQALQCASDVSTIYWEWSVEKKKMFGNLRTTHTCRDFDKIKDNGNDQMGFASRQQENMAGAYSEVKQNDFEDEILNQPMQIKQRSSRWDVLRIVFAFVLGVVMTISLVAALQGFLLEPNASNRSFPEFRQGSDSKSGLPLSWSNGDCGNSPEDARALGCRYSIVLHAWLPQDCLTDDDLEDERLMYDGRTWPYETDEGANLTMHQLHQGDFHHFTTLFDWHVTHCMYVWKRIHRIMLDANRRVDSYTANINHTNHCVKMIGGGSHVHYGVILVECVLGVLLIAGYVSLNALRSSASGHASLDGLSKLRGYNSTMSFQNNSELLKVSQEADDYWHKLLDSGGVVSLNTEWALEQGLRPSTMSPTDPSQSIYQVDVFHALHCLNSLRVNLMSDDPPAFDEKHLSHCLDYIRHQLLCHPDLTLVRTNDLEEFVLDETHQCRDYGAILDWVHQHRWVEFPEWLKAKTQSQ
ncbi:Cyclochlorotine biosynthesis protein R [Paramyrothecium foliicola]|nr:Cyclochlorotine biosynthesis protein R [Paramyrothecium foliicola]